MTDTVNPLFQRLQLLTGNDAAAALEKSRVLVVGIGGVGSWCAEALVRSGVGAVSLADFDTVAVTNTNRQVEALRGNIGRLKTDALGERLGEINPSCEIRTFPFMFSKATAERFGIPDLDFVIDAIDTISCKLDLIEAALSAGKRLFSSMGMGWKLDPTMIKTADIWETSGCPLARLVRQGLRNRNVSGHFTAVYSPEQLPFRGGLSFPGASSVPPDAVFPRARKLPDTPSEGSPIEAGDITGGSKSVNGSCVTVTASAGMVLASLVIRDVCARFGGERGSRGAALPGAEFQDADAHHG